MSGVRRWVAKDVVSCGDEGDDGALLFNPDNQKTAIVNPVGRAIWAALATPKTVDEIAAFLTESYRGVSLEQARQDAARFVARLAPDFVDEAEPDV